MSSNAKVIKLTLNKMILVHVHPKNHTLTTLQGPAPFPLVIQIKNGILTSNNALFLIKNVKSIKYITSLQVNVKISARQE